jgi:hypothetical protein
VVVGARPPVYQKALVRDNRTGKLAEIDMNPELPPLDEGEPGRTYVFKPNEEVEADHPRCSIAQARLSQSRAERRQSWPPRQTSLG